MPEFEVEVRTTYYETFRVTADTEEEAKTKALNAEGPAGSVFSEAEVDSVRELAPVQAGGEDTHE